jgi:hypothetical protein
MAAITAPRRRASGEMAREIGGRDLSHMADAQREDQPRQRDAPFLVDRVEEVGRRFLAPALAVLQLLQPAP